MAGLFERPEAPTSPGKGLMRKDQFQVAYVTNDLDRACEIFGQRYGIREYGYIRGDMPQGGKIAVALAWVGNTCYEIIEAEGPETGFYNSRLPSGEFAIRFHHLGFLIHDRDSWQRLEKEFEAEGWPIAYKTLNNGFMDAYYVEAPELGHYLEYIYPEQAGVDFFRSLPGSGSRPDPETATPRNETRQCRCDALAGKPVAVQSLKMAGSGTRSAEVPWSAS